MYFDEETGVCYETTRANTTIAKTKGVISDINLCAPTRICSEFKVEKYEATTYAVELLPYEACIVKVSNVIKYDYK
jgi:hypothetical protein